MSPLWKNARPIALFPSKTAIKASGGKSSDPKLARLISRITFKWVGRPFRSRPDFTGFLPICTASFGTYA